MRRETMAVVAAMLAVTTLAAPKAKVEPVAEGFPDWQGLTDKNYICGRQISPADLRHKITIVVDVEPNSSLASQLALAGTLAALNGLCGWHVGDNWETKELPRNVIFVASYSDVKNVESFKKALATKSEDQDFRVKLGYYTHPSVPVYCNVTFTGAPEVAGKRPYIYVMGPTGKTPIYQGTLDKAAISGANKAISAERKKMADTKWLPFYGSIPEPQFHPQFTKAIDKGKPLTALEKELKKSIVSKDAEKAAEAQILSDALTQTRDDLVLRIKLEAAACPHRAYYDFQQLVKYWPAEKKRLDAVLLKLKQIPDADKMAKMFSQVMVWANVKFAPKNESDAKKIVGELNKMKMTLEKLKESKVVVIQNGAQLLDMQIDELISSMPMRVPEK